MEQNEKLAVGDIVQVHVYRGNRTFERTGILVERFRNGWIIAMERGENGVTTSFSPDGDPRLEYRTLGSPN